MTTASTARHEAGVQGTAPAEFRRRLLEGMAAAIRETGYREATVADVVRHARTSRRTFYEHFPSKQACFIDLLREANAAMIRQIGAAVDRRAPWDAQVRQAIEAWIAVAQADLALTLSWIRDLPSLGADARHLQREWLEAFIVLVRELTDTPELRAAGVGQFPAVPPAHDHDARRPARTGRHHRRGRRRHRRHHRGGRPGHASHARPARPSRARLTPPIRAAAVPRTRDAIGPHRP